ncbi:MAG: hypothetical protein JWM11_6507, partial [Planctomycetaceae bacterium]|nr:hypothetical protein [Planctomycetaceae bacterium]
MTSATTHGQPIDYFELEQHRLHNLANSMTLAITEGFGEYVDTREWQQDDPSFGFGRVGSPILYTSLNDRDDGKYLPIYQTQMDLAAIRAEARNVTAMSGGVMGAIGTLSNYTLGGGLKFTAQRAASCPANIAPEAIQSFIAEAQAVIDRFLHENKFQSDMDREIDNRSREDGEAFVELSVSPAGQIRASFDEPDMVCQPSSPEPIEDWLRDQDYQRYSPDWTWSWSFGIHCIRRSPDDPQGYHVVYDTSGDDWEYIPACRMLHVKRNVPRNAKRGVSDLYWIANDVQREAKIRRNTADGAALQAAIAWFREHAQGTTVSAVQSMVDGQAVDFRQQRTSSGTRPTRQGKLRSGTVVDIPESMKVLPGPMGSERNANFILIAQYVARAIAQRWAMPEFMFTSDASNANYASTLVAESPFVKARETDQRFYSQAFVELLWKVLRLAHEIGRAFRNIEKFDDLRQFVEITATGPRVSNRDELQTVQRQQIEVDMGTLSLETAAAEMGRDLAKEQAKGAHPKDDGSETSMPANSGDITNPTTANRPVTVQDPDPAADPPDDPDSDSVANPVEEAQDEELTSLTECPDSEFEVPASAMLQEVIAAMALLLEKLAEKTATGATATDVQLLLQEIADVKARAAVAAGLDFVQESVLECNGKGGKHGPCKKAFKSAKTASKSPASSTNQDTLTVSNTPSSSTHTHSTIDTRVQMPLNQSKSAGKNSKSIQSQTPGKTKNVLANKSPTPGAVKSPRDSNPNTRIRQRYAHAIQKHVAKGIGGIMVDDNAPSDVMFHLPNGKSHHIEVKGLLDRKTQDIRMTSGAFDRKARTSSDTGNEYHTVAVDRRNNYKWGKNQGANYSGHQLYYKRGGGS